jgi:hypothetical protein
MTNDGFEPYVTPYRPSGGSISDFSKWFSTPTNNVGGNINFKGAMTPTGTTEWGNRADYVGKLGPALGIYSSDQASLVQDWV